MIKVSYRLNGTPLRDIINKVHDLGFKSAKFCPDEDKNSIGEILGREVTKYRNKFATACAVWLPILILMWVIPYSNPEFLSEHVIFNGMPLYIFLLLGVSSII